MKNSYKSTLIIGLIFFIFLLGGASPLSERCTVTIMDGEETFLCEPLTFSKKVAMRLIFLHFFNIEHFYKNEYLGSPNELIRDLNPMLYERIEQRITETDILAIEPTSDFFDGEFDYTEGKNGRSVNRDALYSDIVEQYSANIKVELVKKQVLPLRTVKDLQEETCHKSAFSTGFATSAENRKNNIKIAASKLNNLVIAPGEKLSFNESVGERTRANGYLEANVISGGKFVPAVGGGVCQVSTTLYNAWLHAGLKVEKSATHSLPVGYVAPSLDAMVSSATDLVLVNDSPCPVYIYTRCVADRLTVRLFGLPDDFTVKLVSVKLKILEAKYETEEGDFPDWGEEETERIVKRAINGLESESFREFYKNGVLVERQLLRRSVYGVQNGIKIVRKRTLNPLPDGRDGTETVKLDDSVNPINQE